ncbi:EamA family transporter [Variovorax sp. OV329]|uniref:EamA family transporter n=1 Tax=Variovorax sp. OV329 TaxID=1882825 RepID=UPI0008E70757|nr:EamA family transporter [Variovorax sp. OV329]SFL87593.1 undecaprenyl phosphate-alpha-L-ara4N flippase subunit ArnE [Variovorax sp. OV329]
MRPWQVILLVGYTVGIALGQLLFKQAAVTLKARESTSQFVWMLMTNAPLVCAVLLYAGLTALWVYILSITDLSKAYPFHALTMVLTPLLAARLFDEKLNGYFYVGLAAILVGIFFIAWGSES